jgi:hypothetical protein
VISKVKVTQAIHPDDDDEEEDDEDDDDDGKACDAADHARAVGWGVTTVKSIFRDE